MAEWLLYEHDDGRHAVAPSAEAATFAKGDPAWHRVGPVEVPMAGLSRAAEIVQAEIDRAEALLNVEDGGAPVFDRAQTEAGICALRAVLETIKREAPAGVRGLQGCTYPNCAGEPQDDGKGCCACPTGVGACATCNGRGWIETLGEGGEPGTQTCPDCNGTGKAPAGVPPTDKPSTPEEARAMLRRDIEAGTARINGGVARLDGSQP